MSANAPQSGSDDGLDDLLRQLRDQPAPEPRPYFYARVRARLDAEASEAPSSARLWLRPRPTYALVLGVLVLGVNIGAVMHYTRSAPPPERVVAATRYDAFVSEYQLDPFSLPLPQ